MRRQIGRTDQHLGVAARDGELIVQLVLRSPGREQDAVETGVLERQERRGRGRRQHLQELGVILVEDFGSAVAADGQRADQPPLVD